MGGYLLLAAYLACGLAVADGLFRGRDRLTRVWLGLCAGLVLMMWLPTLLAFFLRFTALAQLLGLAVAAGAAGASQIKARGKPRAKAWTGMPLWLPLALVIPFAILGGWLQYTHTLREVDGALHVGQSTYGDLCLHLGIATGLRNAAYPPQYTLLPGARLGYPFLADGMVTSMLLLGADLRGSFVVTGTLMMVLTYLGFLVFAWEVTHSRGATVAAFLLMFLNGGLGFLYALDGVWKDSTAFREIFTGFYATPTNQPELNLRWVNVVCDMMVPQRTLLAGWMALLPALWLLVTAVREDGLGTFVTLGVWAGALPMIHTHSFLALGLISAGAVAWVVAHAPRGQRADAFRPFLIYGCIAVALAAPQLFTWAVPQTVRGGSLGLLFNWVNNRGNGRLIDGYCWFWIKNVGPVWLMMVPAALEGGKDRRDPRRWLGCGALCVYAVAELVQFQPNVYDNNKLFYVAFMAMLPAVGLYLRRLWRKLRGLRGRALLAAAFIAMCSLSGLLTVGREVVSDYQLFGPDEAEAAAFIDAQTPTDAVFLTGNQHNNAAAALAGRNIVCGTGTYLYFHGIDYSEQEWDERRMLEEPGTHPDAFARYGVDYAYISTHERAAFGADEAWFAANGALVFEAGNVRIYALSDRAKALAAGAAA